MARDIPAGRAFIELFLKDGALMKGLSQARNRMNSFAATSAAAGGAMMAAGGAIAAPLVKGMAAFADFDAQLGNVATMLDRPADFMPGFAESILELSAEFGKTKQELTTGLYDILSATVPPEQAMERLAAATKLAAAGNAEVGDSVSVLNTLMETYGDSFENAGDATDFLFSIVKRGRTNLPELAEKLGSIIATAKAAGMSVEDMGASVALLTRATGSTTSALTALNAISGTFLKPSETAIKTWEANFGDAMNSSTLETLGMTGVLERLSTLSADDIAKIFPNLRAIRGIFPAIEKMEGFSDDLAAMSNRAGNVETALEKVKGPLFYWNQFLQQIDNAFIKIGKALEPVYLRLFEMGSGGLAWFSDFLDNNIALVPILGNVAVGLLAAGAALIGLSIAVKTMALLLTVFLGTVAALKAIVVFGPALLGIGLAIALAKDELIAFGSYLGGHLLDLFGRLSEVWGTAWEGIQAAISQGDWESAAEIAMMGVEAAMAESMVTITGMWEDLKYVVAESIAGGVILGLQSYRKLAEKGFGGIGGMILERSGMLGAYEEDKQQELMDWLKGKRRSGEYAVSDAQENAAAARLRLEERTETEVGKKTAGRRAAGRSRQQGIDEDWESLLSKQIAEEAANFVPVTAESMRNDLASHDWEDYSAGMEEEEAIRNMLASGQLETATSGVSGSFSAAAAQSFALGAGQPIDRVAKAAETTVARLDTLITETERQTEAIEDQGAFE